MKPQQILVGALLLSAAGLGAFLAFGAKQRSAAMCSRAMSRASRSILHLLLQAALSELAVQRGDAVKAGAKFFAVDPAQSEAARDQTAARN